VAAGLRRDAGRDGGDLTRLRTTQMEERSRAIQRLEKVLQDAGIKFSNGASKTYSVSARAMLEALLGGVSDPAALAARSGGGCRGEAKFLPDRSTSSLVPSNSVPDEGRGGPGLLWVSTTEFAHVAKKAQLPGRGCWVGSLA
jgi:hypothetical protein